MKGEQSRILTDREYEVVTLMMKGLTSKEISEKLYLSPPPIETHKRRLIKKYGVKNATALVATLIRLGIV